MINDRELNDTFRRMVSGDATQKEIDAAFDRLGKMPPDVSKRDRHPVIKQHAKAIVLLAQKTESLNVGWVAHPAVWAIVSLQTAGIHGRVCR